MNDENQVLENTLFNLDDLHGETRLLRGRARTAWDYRLAETTPGKDLVSSMKVFFSHFMYSIHSTVGPTRSSKEPYSGGWLHAQSSATSQGRPITHSGGPDPLPAMSNYPLYGTLGDVLHKGHPTAELGYRIRDTMTDSERALLMPTFFDHHDIERMIENDSVAGLQQGLLLIMTLPGIPVIHYATEHVFTENRGARLSRGEGAGDAHRSNASAPLEHFVAQLTRLRKENTVFSHGMPAILDESRTGPGAFAFKMTEGDRVAIVAINTSDHQCLTRTFATGILAGTPLENRVAIGSTATPLIVAADGTVTATLPARSAFAWISRGEH